MGARTTITLTFEEQASLVADVAQARADYRAGLFVGHAVVIAESEARYEQLGDRAPDLSNHRR